MSTPISASSPLFEKLSDAVAAGDEELSADIAQKLIIAGLDATDAAIQGLTRGIDLVGQRFTDKEYYLTDVILALDAFKAGLKKLKPHIKPAPGDDPTHDVAENILKLVQEKVQAILCGDPEKSNAACACSTCVKIYEQMSAFVTK